MGRERIVACRGQGGVSHGRAALDAFELDRTGAAHEQVVRIVDGIEAGVDSDHRRTHRVECRRIDPGFDHLVGPIRAVQQHASVLIRG